MLKVSVLDVPRTESKSFTEEVKNIRRVYLIKIETQTMIVCFWVARFNTQLGNHDNGSGSTPPPAAATKRLTKSVNFLNLFAYVNETFLSAEVNKLEVKFKTHQKILEFST